MSKPKEFDEIIHCERIGDSLLYNHYVVSELVRCKNCKYGFELRNGKFGCDYFDSKYPYAEDYAEFNPDDFCSRGVKKDEVKE